LLKTSLTAATIARYAHLLNDPARTAAERIDVKIGAAMHGSGVEIETLPKAKGNWH
jgi:hypothetical protein